MRSAEHAQWDAAMRDFHVRCLMHNMADASAAMLTCEARFAASVGKAAAQFAELSRSIARIGQPPPRA